MIELRVLADLYQQVQKTRVAMGNRLLAAKDGRDTTSEPNIYRTYHVRLQELENLLVSDMRRLVRDHPAYPWLQHVKGVSSILGCKLLGLIGDIRGFETVSKLWRFAGLAVIDGQAERPRKGEKRHYNARLKTTCYLIGRSFLLCDSPYRRIYDAKKEYYEHERPDWTPLRRHLAAMRAMEKRFLAHLWEVWREAEGLPIRRPYVQEKLGHAGIDDPWEYVEREVKPVKRRDPEKPCEPLEE